ncbi:MAG TPA: PqqD family protein [Longimicrobiaceae bacterium]
MSQRLPFKSPTVIFRPMEDGGVLFCSRSEAYFGLSRVGAKIWEMLPDANSSVANSFDELIRSLQQTYTGVDAETLIADTREFLERIGELELTVDAPAT